MECGGKSATASMKRLVFVGGRGRRVTLSAASAGLPHRGRCLIAASAPRIGGLLGSRTAPRPDRLSKKAEPEDDHPDRRKGVAERLHNTTTRCAHKVGEDIDVLYDTNCKS